MRNEVVENVKKVIKDNYDDADCGIFFTRNLVGDLMGNIYKNGDVEIDICYHWSYFEVFGLTEDEEEVIEEYYEELRSKE